MPAPENTPQFQVVKNPITVAGRRLAVEKESRIVLDAFEKNAVRRTSWTVEDIPAEELRQYGNRLSPDTINVVEGFMGVESYISDYTQELLLGYQGFPVYHDFVVRDWTPDERKHGPSLVRGLIESGVRTQQQMDDYEERRSKQHWSPTKHPGMDNQIGALGYSTVQEKGTLLDYLGARRSVRQDYGLPINRTPEEARLGHEIGLSGILSLNARDETAHHSILLDFYGIEYKYFRDEVEEKHEKIKSGFIMPTLDILPNKLAFLKAYIRSGVASERDLQSDILAPIEKRLAAIASSQE